MFYLKGAEGGHKEAQNSLGLMYAGGKSVVQNYSIAVDWFRKSSEQGNAQAQVNLGSAYESGVGVVKGNIYGHMWYNVAASSGIEEGKNARDEIAKKMTSAEIAKAQELARECVKKQYKGC